MWWADTADVPGLTVVADTLPELRQLIDEAAQIHLPGRDLAYLLVQDEPVDAPAPAVEIIPTADDASTAPEVLPPNVGVPARTRVVTTLTHVAA